MFRFFLVFLVLSFAFITFLFQYQLDTMWISTVPKLTQHLAAFKLDARDTPQISLIRVENPRKDKEGVYTLK